MGFINIPASLLSIYPSIHVVSTQKFLHITQILPDYTVKKLSGNLNAKCGNINFKWKNMPDI